MPGAKVVAGANMTIAELTKRLQNALRQSSVEDAFIINRQAADVIDHAAKLCRKYDLPEACEEFKRRSDHYRLIRSQFRDCRCFRR